jgi:hypothetical protein
MPWIGIPTEFVGVGFQNLATYGEQRFLCCSFVLVDASICVKILWVLRPLV